MNPDDINRFNGFSPEAVRFLSALERNNNKPWFEEHKKDYETHILNPMKALASEMVKPMLDIDPKLAVQPVSKIVSRIYRDTRFSKEKSPYKTTSWLTFKHSREDWTDTPVFFFELGAENCRYGMGFYSASAQTMKMLRLIIDEDEKRFLKAVSFMKDTGVVLEGESYKKVINTSKSGIIFDWYQKKSCYLVKNRKIDELLFSRNILEELCATFKKSVPLYKILWEAKERASE